ncbi:hypothetical protein LTR64_007681 [Lithohypha guttulata]|uniref:Glycoside hydrolase family 43 protein n=1 Tax=Lithohypha guttulata TaxID=1690604 RepID=A0AAN7SXT4_9EURO|nr:hypothetical protein LTR51_007190 [Lithohypha guttulata]KAK5084380.1 hypothetical protein LTR05_005456 [Lithohypha guttulata]
MLSSLFFTTVASIFGLVLSQSIYGSDNATFTNPILQKYGADPWVVRNGDDYLMTYTTNDNITILRSRTLTDWNSADVKLAFKAPENTSYTFSNWAPELHYYEAFQKWYIIYTADVDPDSPSPQQDMLCDFNCPAVNHRMFVLESSGPDPWTSEFTMKAELNTYDQFAIDGTYFQYDNKLYHIYSCWYDYDSQPFIRSWPAMLCITQMSDPWTVSSPQSERLIISKPEQPWEKTPYGRTVNDRLSSNEGPQQLINPNTKQNFVIYSAARSDNRNYCLGLIELTGTNPMDINSWTKNNASCVFYENDAEQVYGVGHASFVQSPDDSQWWIVYHGMRDYLVGWSARQIRAQQFTWDEKTGWPVFPRPGIGPYPVPSGQ